MHERADPGRKSACREERGGLSEFARGRDQRRPGRSEETPSQAKEAIRATVQSTEAGRFTDQRARARDARPVGRERETLVQGEEAHTKNSRRRGPQAGRVHAPSLARRQRQQRLTGHGPLLLLLAPKNPAGYIGPGVQLPRRCTVCQPPRTLDGGRAAGHACAVVARGQRRETSQPLQYLLAALSTASISIVAKAAHDSIFSNERIFAVAACRAKVSTKSHNPSAPAYVARVQADAELGALVHRPSKRIVLAIGPRGVGKTTSLLNAMEQIDGALLVKVTGVHESDSSVYATIWNQVVKRGPTTPLVEADMDSFLNAATHRYRRQHGVNNNNNGLLEWKPTIILQFDTLIRPEMVKVAVQTLQGLVCDQGACHGIISGSDAHSIYAEYALTSDRVRHHFCGLATSPAPR
ncbi:hypothetical protein T492DRAFT_1142108 [Pavlovales sp. CCMP2436]|nr:hypothetical protein T492DRAFT_1142108 [Pavlovales sp. CCMP2436]